MAVVAAEANAGGSLSSTGDRGISITALLVVPIDAEVDENLT